MSGPTVFTPKILKRLLLELRQLLVYDLKSVGALKIEFDAPIPEQTGTPTMHFSNVSG